MPGTPPAPAQGETLDRLVGNWWIFQLERGHRYATDDVLAAWAASGAKPNARRVLDLGCGVGSLGLMALFRLPQTTRLTSVEVQERSTKLLEKTLAHNGLEERVEVVRGDLRRVSLDGPFDLIVANPPYLPQAAATRSPHPQRAAARLELHGDIFDYCEVAARLLDEDGRFCFCFAAADPRPEQAVRNSGLLVLTRQNVIGRAGRPPLLAVFVCGRCGERRDAPTLVVRDEGGVRTEAYCSIRREMFIDA